MKRCLACNSIYFSSLTACPDCGFEPAIFDNFVSYAPEFSHNSDGFRSGYFNELAHLEESNFWFRVRNKLIVWALGKYSPDFSLFMEIGCGTGFVLSGILKKFPYAKLSGSEIFVAGLSFADKRLGVVDLMQMDARNIPFMDEFDVIGAFDVLEHIKEDELVLKQISNALKSNGVMLLTVPQHEWLWSSTDDYACHVRRYSACDLYEKINNAGFEIVRSTSFVSLLLPVMVASRLYRGRSRDNDVDVFSELRLNPILNFVFEKLLEIELAIIRFGMSFPFGGSRLVVAKKI